MAGQYVNRELISDFVKLGITWFSPQELRPVKYNVEL